MNPTKFMGLLLGVIGVVLLVGGLYLAISYVGTLMNAMIDFITANSSAISKCGITVPEMFVELKGQVATTILPLIYIGIPLAVVVISLIMFAGGYYYGKGSFKDELHKEMKHEEEVEEEVERRVSKKKRRAEPEEEPEEEE